MGTEKDKRRITINALTPAQWSTYCDTHGHPPNWRPVHAQSTAVARKTQALDVSGGINPVPPRNANPQ